MQNTGNKILEVNRGSAFKWSRIVIYVCFIVLMLLTLLLSSINLYIQLIITLCICLFIYSLIIELQLDRSKTVVTVFEDGIESEFLKYSGSCYIPWTDIKEIELVKGWFHYRRCYYLWLKPHDTIKYNYKIPWTVAVFYDRKHELGFNALSLNISFGLNIDPHSFHTACEDAFKKSINGHSFEGNEITPSKPI